MLARMMTEGDPHLPVSSSLSLRMQAGGIATAQDVSKTVALKYALLEEIMTRDIVAIGLSDPIERSTKKMNEHNISAFSVVNEGESVTGMVTSDGVNRLVGVCR